MPVTRQRRSQEERSAETRERLLDATIECLMTYGYAGTTTPRVAELAGLTRGAQVHHFGSKNDLIIAAVQHLATKRVVAAVPELVDGLNTADDPVGVLLDLLWEVHSGPVFVPIVELWVAGRTDPTLRQEVARFGDTAVTAIIATAAETAPEEILGPMLDFIYLAMDALRGILVSSFVDSDPTRARRRWDRASTTLRRIGDPIILDWRAKGSSLPDR